MGAQKLFFFLVVRESESDLRLWASNLPQFLRFPAARLTSGFGSLWPGLDWTGLDWSMCLTQLAAVAKLQTHSRSSEQSGRSICVIIVINEEINGVSKEVPDGLGSASPIHSQILLSCLYFLLLKKKKKKSIEKPWMAAESL